MRRFGCWVLVVFGVVLGVMVLRMETSRTAQAWDKPRLLVSAWGVTSNSELFVLNSEGQIIRQLTNDPVNNFFVGWLGPWAVIHNSDLYTVNEHILVDVYSGETTRLYSQPAGARWLGIDLWIADSRRLVTSFDLGGQRAIEELRLSPGGQVEGHQTLLAFDNDTEIHTLTANDDWLLYQSTLDDRVELYSMSMTTESPKEHLLSPELGYRGLLEFSADGHWALWLQSIASEDYDPALMRARLDGSVEAEPVYLFESGHNLKLSTGRRWVVWEDTHLNPVARSIKILELSPDGRIAAGPFVIENYAGGYDDRLWFPMWSPNERWLFILLSQGEGSHAIVAADLHSLEEGQFDIFRFDAEPTVAMRGDWQNEDWVLGGPSVGDVSDRTGFWLDLYSYRPTTPIRWADGYEVQATSPDGDWLVLHADGGLSRMWHDGSDLRDISIPGWNITQFEAWIPSLEPLAWHPDRLAITAAVLPATGVALALLTRRIGRASPSQ